MYNDPDQNDDSNKKRFQVKTCQACGLIQREVHQMLKHIHKCDDNTCCLRGPSYNMHIDICERLNQYNLKHKSELPLQIHHS